jgi:hypothetical protein
MDNAIQKYNICLERKRVVIEPSKWGMWGQCVRQGALGETAEVGEPPEGDEEAIDRCLRIAVLRVSCDSQVGALLLRGVTVARKKAKRSEPVNDMLPGWRNTNG